MTSQSHPLAKEHPKNHLIIGNPALLVIDIQGGGYLDDAEAGIPHMPGYADRVAKATALISAARHADTPVIFFQEAHRPSMVDFGRELDGTEGVHCLETSPSTAILPEIGFRPDQDLFIRKRRYSCFFGTELEILLKGLKTDTVILIGGLTDVCVQYTFVDAHQHDYHARVVDDAVGGSSVEFHEAALKMMEYLQTGARRQTDEVLAAFAARSAARPPTVAAQA